MENSENRSLITIGSSNLAKTEKLLSITQKILSEIKPQYENVKIGGQEWISENSDIFPRNVGETLGTIEKKSYTFNYKTFQVWQDGIIIYSGKSKGQIIAKVSNGILNVKIDDIMINNHIIKNFSFGEISQLDDRIMWSKDLFNSNRKTERNNPDISSLFFINLVLSKVTFTIYEPNTVVEFYS